MRGVQGGRDAWLWAPETLSAVLHFDMYFRFTSGFVVGLGVHAAEMVGIDEFDGDLETLVQADLDFAYEHKYVRAMLRASYVTVPTADFDSYDDVDLLAAHPEVRFRIPDAVDIVVGLSFNIDKPLGISFVDSGALYGVTLGVSTPTTPNVPKPKKRRRFE